MSFWHLLGSKTASDLMTLKATAAELVMAVQRHSAPLAPSNTDFTLLQHAIVGSVFILVTAVWHATMLVADGHCACASNTIARTTRSTAAAPATFLSIAIAENRELGKSQTLSSIGTGGNQWRWWRSDFTVMVVKPEEGLYGRL
jgi:hypothetical protein